jgi:centromere protein C
VCFPCKGSWRKIAGQCQANLRLLTGSGPEPAQSIRVRKLVQSAKTRLPPPKARSPVKTSLGSSPRRHSSFAPRAHSPSLITPDKDKSPTVTRRLNFNAEIVDNVGKSTPKLRNGVAKQRGRKELDSDVYDLPTSPAANKGGYDRVGDGADSEEDHVSQEESAINLVGHDMDEELDLIHSVSGNNATPTDDDIDLHMLQNGKRKRHSVKSDTIPQKRKKSDRYSVNSAVKPVMSSGLQSGKRKGKLMVSQPRKTRSSYGNASESSIIQETDESEVQPSLARGRKIMNKPKPTKQLEEFESGSELEAPVVKQPRRRRTNAASDQDEREEEQDREVTLDSFGPGSQTKKRRSQKGTKALKPHPAVDDSVEEVEPAVDVTQANHGKRRGRPPKAKPKSAGGGSKAAPLANSTRRRGRPSKSSTETSIMQDNNHTSSSMAPPPLPIQKNGRLLKTAAQKADTDGFIPDSKLISRKGRAASVMSDTSRGTTMSTRSNVNYRLRIPGNESARSRSGRLLQRPLNHWMGEQNTYNHDGEVLETMTAEEVPFEKLRRGPFSRRSRLQHPETVYEEPGDEELEEWERDPGVIFADVQNYETGEIMEQCRLRGAIFQAASF